VDSDGPPSGRIAVRARPARPPAPASRRGALRHPVSGARRVPRFRHRLPPCRIL